VKTDCKDGSTAAAARAEKPGGEPGSAQASAARADKAKPAQIAIVGLGLVAFLYFARPVMLPVLLGWIAAVTLQPPMRWLSHWHIPRPLSAAVLLCLLVSAFGVGFYELGRPALKWVNEAPQHMTDLRRRVQKNFPRLGRFSEAVAAVSSLGATEEEKTEEQRKAPTVEVKESRGASAVINWTGSFLVCAVETVVLLYLLLASGDFFLQKLVRMAPTSQDKESAIEISREIQRNISHYLFSVSLINIGLGLAVSGGLCLMGVPNAAMWGMFAAALNFVPYLGPVVGVFLLATVGLLTFDTLWSGLLPAAWYLLLHLLESNLVTPVVLGRRFALHPVVIFVSLIFWTWLWGLPGAFLSAPILVSMKVVCERLPALSRASQLLTS